MTFAMYQDDDDDDVHRYYITFSPFFFDAKKKTLEKTPKSVNNIWSPYTIRTITKIYMLQFQL